MPRNPLHDVAIVGAYDTKQEKRIEDMTEIQCLRDAIQGALDDCGLTVADVDGNNISSSTWRVNPREAAQLMGGAPVWTGSEMGIAGVLEAAAAIATGQCEVALIATAQVGQYTERMSTSPWTRPANEFVECWGLYTAAEFALIAQRHMHLYGTPPEALAEVAAAIRMNGARNPKAVMYQREVTPQDVLDSRMVADPYHLLDCCINSEGGSGIVLTSAARAKDLDCEPIWLLGGGLDRQGMGYVTAPVWDKYGWVGRRAADMSFEQAGITRDEVDVAEFYDPFSFEIIRQLEAYRFCKEGEGAGFVLDGNVRIDGQLPVATNGGLMSYSHAGLAQLLQKPISAVNQLRGNVPDVLRVPDAKIAITSNGGAGALFCDVMLLGKEQA